MTYPLERLRVSMDPDELRLLAYLADSDFRSLSDQLCSLVWEEAQRRGLVEASKGQPVRSGSHAATRVTKELRGKVAEELIDIYYQLRLGEERNDTLDFGAAADRILTVVQRHRGLRMINCFTWIDCECAEFKCPCGLEFIMVTENVYYCPKCHRKWQLFQETWVEEVTT